MDLAGAGCADGQAVRAATVPMHAHATTMPRLAEHHLIPHLHCKRIAFAHDFVAVCGHALAQSPAAVESRGKRVIQWVFMPASASRAHGCLCVSQRFPETPKHVCLRCTCAAKHTPTSSPAGQDLIRLKLKLVAGPCLWGMRQSNLVMPPRAEGEDNPPCSHPLIMLAKMS